MSSDPSSHGPGSPSFASSAAPASTSASPGSHGPDSGPRPLARLAPLALGALGIVYGDIGTSPLYALRDCFSGSHGISPTQANVLGVLSLVFWSLLIVISVKYLGFVMRADNRGEGGVLSLLALLVQRGGGTGGGMRRWVLLTLGLFGAALLYGDGVITPAVSVLSAVEGLAVATPLFTPYVVPIALVILLALFLVQRKGTGGIGRVFGPLMVVWFTVIAVLGVLELVRNPAVLQAVSPTYAVHFFAQNGWHGFLVLGAVFLVVTGGESMYADMGHFGYRPIRFAWFGLVLPAFLLNYFGQGALLLRSPSLASNPFFYMAPGWALYPLVALATAATVIASQALISGVFSLTRQAIQLGYWPRLEVVHTSAEERGQIYLPGVNLALMLGVMVVVLGFRTSTALMSAYGIAVAATMTITTSLAYVVARERWGLRRSLLVPLAAVFLSTRYGFMEDPSIPDILKRCREAGLPFNVMSTSFFLGRETLIVSKKPGMAMWREALFVWMSRNARSATAFFRIPPNRVVELGAQVEL